MVEVSVPSLRDGKGDVTFEFLRGAPESLPAMALTQKSLKTLYRECDAEGLARQNVAAATGAEATADPGTPRKKVAKRRVHPFARSPGVPSPMSSRKRRAEVHFRAGESRVQARWAEQDGSWAHESWRVEHDGDPDAVERVRAEAYAHARKHHHRGE